VQGGLAFTNLIKNQAICSDKTSSDFIVQLRGLEICLVGTGPNKAPCGGRTGNRETSTSKSALPKHAKFIKFRATPFLSLSC